ncbi:MAG: S-methyl-5-thioribose-1-phosphate isomerase [Planctomycetota bacterium]
MPYLTIQWRGGIPGKIVLIDQTRLPSELAYLEIEEPRELFDAIRRLAVRGAPAIGISAAYGVVLGIQGEPIADREALVRAVERSCSYLATSRPTAVNLFWALERMRRRARSLAPDLSPLEMKLTLLEEAHAILEEDRLMGRRIGENAQRFLRSGDTTLTHCNAGGLATAEYGTALAAFFEAARLGKTLHVFADETRPLLQGARLTAWELRQAGIDVTLICDNMAGQVMQQGKVSSVFVGADRIAANGDAANKIGTYSVAVLARHHQIPFYVAAPTTTFDLSIPDGSHIPLEERDPTEVTHPLGLAAAPEGIGVYNPAFDVTPHTLITAIITEHGVIERPDAERIAEHFRDSGSRGGPAEAGG